MVTVVQLGFVARVVRHVDWLDESFRRKANSQPSPELQNHAAVSLLEFFLRDMPHALSSISRLVRRKANATKNYEECTDYFIVESEKDIVDVGISWTGSSNLPDKIAFELL
jgi:hypothetical protein